MPFSNSVYMKALATFTELAFKLAGWYGSREQNINGQDHLSIIIQITQAMDQLLKENLYEVFYSQFRGTLIGLNIRYKEYKGTPDEKEWINNIIEDSADLLGLIKQTYETEVKDNLEHAVLTLGIYTDVILFRATVMSERKHTYQMDRDKEIKDMLQDCKDKIDKMIEKKQRIYENKKNIADNCEEPEPTPGTLALSSCFLYENDAKIVHGILINLNKQKESIEKTISIIPV
ncbi:hypothetical protein P4U97_10020 [Bacillus swezeyi]|uniref:hypothetical protein n=1 Tax=Bacillus TaxID=1386 RepID=UPI000427F609|nr:MULTISPECIES: hypothetical protein [Bacillus]MED1739839.1 hypothetical protein [Bacillus swezeyi]